jgi:hypothetical protein
MLASPAGLDALGPSPLERNPPITDGYVKSMVWKLPWASTTAGRLAVIVVWVAACVGITLVLSVTSLLDALDVSSQRWVALALFVPIHFAMGYLVRHWAAVVLPLLITFPLAELSYELTCPCGEGEFAYSMWIWALLFGFPGALVVMVGAGLGRERQTLDS